VTAPTAKSPQTTLAQVRVIAAGYGVKPEVVDALVSSAKAVAVAEERARILAAADRLVAGAGPALPATFEGCRRTARRLLGDAADQIRAGDWEPLPTRAQRDAVRRALVLIGEAEDALDEAAFMDTIDLDEEDR
jgi:hypothetical protein